MYERIVHTYSCFGGISCECSHKLSSNSRKEIIRRRKSARIEAVSHLYARVLRLELLNSSLRLVVPASKAPDDAPPSHAISSGWELIHDHLLGVDLLELFLEHLIKVVDVDDVCGALDDQDPGDWLGSQERRREMAVPVCPDLAALHDELALLGQASQPLGLLPGGKDHLCCPFVGWAVRRDDLAEQDPSSWANAGDGSDQLADGAAWRKVLDPECGIVVGGVAEQVGTVHCDAWHADVLIRLGDGWVL